MYDGVSLESGDSAALLKVYVDYESLIVDLNSIDILYSLIR